MRKKALILAFLLVFTSLSAQTKSRGISNVGKITKPKIKYNEAVNKLFGEKDKQLLTCTALFMEPSGDGVLSEGETGFVLINVKNNSLEKQIQPKLEIILKSSWNPTPHSVVKFMDPIEPGQSGQYEAKMRWDKRLPSGIVTYKVVAVDVNSRVKSKPVELNFSITGKGTKEAEPVFVDVDKTIPKVYASNRYGVAVIIGNQEYSNRDIPNVDYAVKDAAAMKKYLINMFGYREENIIYVENAQKTDFESIFGTVNEYKGKLYNYIKPNKSDVFIYYSGHGAPDLSSKKAYFMPSNSDPNYVKIYGYPLDVFYKNINKIPAKSITIVIDACFSGGSQQGMLIKNASPMYIDVQMQLYSNRINLLTSSAGDEISSWYPAGNHSLFTYYFLRAIRGEADKNRDRSITLREVSEYLKENVPYMARRLYGREQTPILKGDFNKIVRTY